MDILLLLTVSIAPGLFLVYRYFSKDIYKKEPWAVIWKSFLWGAATLIPAAFLELSISIPEKDKLLGMLIEIFLVIALTEELCKFLVIRFYSYRDIHFDEMMDGIVYGVAAASGFATFENIFYVMDHGLMVGLMRAVLSVPSHVFSGAILGYWLAKARFQQISYSFAILTSFSIVVLAHGFFDFVISYEKASYAYLTLIPVIVQAKLVKYYVNQALAYDAAYIHSPERVDTTANTDKISGEEAIQGSVAKNPAHVNSYGRSIIHIGLIFLAVICFLMAAFLLLGFVLIYMEKGEELWTFLIPLTPFALGWYFKTKAKKYAQSSEIS